MAIERQAIDTRLQSVEKTRRTTRTVDTAVDNGMSNYEPSKGLRLAQGLLKLADAGNTIYAKEMHKRIELDKVKQTARAYQGLAPTDDATKQGRQAYEVVTSRDAVLDVNDQIMQSIRTNPDMSDEEFNKATQGAYAGLMGKYENDPKMLAFLSSEMQNSQSLLHKARTDARVEYQSQQNQDAFQHSLNTYKDAARSPGELALAIEGSLGQEGTALGVDANRQRNILINQAQADANNGDSRLLKALEGLEWAQGDTRLKTARNNLESWESQTYATQIGTRMADIQSSWENGRANWSQVEAEIKRTNQRFPGTYTAARIASLRSEGLKKQQEGFALTQAVSASFKPLYDQSATKLGMQGLDDKTQNKVVAAVTQQIQAKADQLVQDGQLSAQDAPKWALKQQVNWSKANQVVIPQVKNTLESIMYMDPEQFNVEGGMPPNVSAAMQAMDVMDPGTLAMYGNEKLAAYYLNYQKFKSQEGDASAFQRAYRQTFDPVKLSQKERSDLSKNMESAIKDKSAGFWSRTLFDGVSIPAFEQNRAAQEMKGMAEDLVTSGAYDVQGVTNYASELWLKQNTQLPNGTYVRGSADQLAPILGVKQAEVGSAFADYLTANITQLQDESGLDELTPSDVRYQYRPQSHSVVIVDRLGNTISDPLRLEDIGASYKSRSSGRKVKNALDAAATERELRERQSRVQLHSDQFIK